MATEVKPVEDAGADFLVETGQRRIHNQGRYQLGQSTLLSEFVAGL